MSMATWGRVVLGRGWQLCCDLAQAVDGILMAADYGIAGFHLRHARPGGLGVWLARCGRVQTAGSDACLFLFDNRFFPRILWMCNLCSQISSSGLWI